jgi:hypothetical protein
MQRILDMQQKDASPNEKDLVVFSIVRDSKCSGCQEELWKGQFLTMEKGSPLCMKCADLDHLIFLGSGDAALSRRSKKYSKLWAVVVRFSRARKRYERQGLLVEEDAVARAEQECLADSGLREARRIRDEERRLREDEVLARDMEGRLKEIFPGCPSGEAKAIAQHASIRGSGRVGRSAAGRNLEEEALRLAAIAFIRHRYTTYDDLLMNGMDRAAARQFVWDKIEETLQHWSKR